MTVVVFDGTSLAVDSHSSDGKAKTPATKVWFHNGNKNVLLTGAGHLSSILEVKDWFERDGSVDDYPKCQQGPRQCVFIVLARHAIYRFESSPHAIEMTGPFAYGAGAEFAYGALHMGATAEQAVEAAITYSPYCFGKPVVYSIEEEV